MAKRVRGVASLRRLLRKLPDEMRAELSDELTAIGARLLGRARAETPVRFGGLRNALSFKVAAKTLMLRIGLISKRDQRRYFYGYILDQGRAGKTVSRMSPRARKEWVGRIAEGKAKARKRPSDLVHPYRVSPISQTRYEFVFGRRRDFRENEVGRLRQVLDRVLSRVARGSGND